MRRKALLFTLLLSFLIHILLLTFFLQKNTSLNVASQKSLRITFSNSYSFTQPPQKTQQKYITERKYLAKKHIHRAKTKHIFSQKTNNISATELMLMPRKSNSNSSSATAVITNKNFDTNRNLSANKAQIENLYDNPPIIKFAPHPDYPEASRRLREEGKVILRVLIDKNGTAIKTKIITSSHFSKLDKSARKTVMHWAFTPAYKSSQPIESILNIPIIFSLQENAH